MSAIAAWAIDTWLGRIVSAVIVGYTFLQGWLFFYHNPKIVRGVETKVERATTNAAHSAISKQRAVRSDGAADRLRREFCPDCQ